jgi:3-isopropylmalate dehydratase small subunit
LCTHEPNLGLGFAAFAELRYENPVEVAQKGVGAAVEKKDFVLNQPAYRDAKVLITGTTPYFTATFFLVICCCLASLCVA